MAAIHRLLAQRSFNVQRRGLSAEMIMSNPIMVNRSGLTNRIYAGRAKPAKNFAFGAMKFVGEKFDVTDQVLHATAHYLAKTDDIKVFSLPDGREIHLRADIKEKQEA